MANISQNDMEHIKDMIDKGEITPVQANVYMIRMMRVKLVTSKIPLQVRKTLNAAVKKGSLGHFKKDGLKPETYFHPDFDYLARQERINYELSSRKSILSVCQ